MAQIFICISQKKKKRKRRFSFFLYPGVFPSTLTLNSANGWRKTQINQIEDHKNKIRRHSLKFGCPLSLWCYSLSCLSYGEGSSGKSLFTAYSSLILYCKTNSCLIHWSGTHLSTKHICWWKAAFVTETANCLIIQVFTLMKQYSMSLEHGVQPNYHPSTHAVKSDYSLASQWVVPTSFLFSNHQMRMTAGITPHPPTPLKEYEDLNLLHIGKGDRRRERDGLSISVSHV